MAIHDFSDASGLLESLKNKAARENKKKNLDLLWSVLTEMSKQGCLDYGLSEVGRRLEKAGGPKTQSIRNEGGQDFRKLIEAFSASVGAVDRVTSVVGKSQLDMAIEAMSDPGLRATFRQVLAENKLLKAQNDQLRSSFKSLSISSSQAGRVEVFDQGGVDILSSRGNLTAFDIEVLRKGIDAGRFAENGWTTMENGSVADDSGLLVLPPGFVTTINKLVSQF